MNRDIITIPENSPVMALETGNERRFEMLEEFALRSGDNGAPVMKLAVENGVKVIRTLDHAGMVCLNDGTRIEVYPNLGVEADKAKLIFTKMLSVYLDIPFDERVYASLRGESSFVEYFIALFLKESMKIMKSGMLSGYSSVEENTSSMQGNIIFSENIRRNLAHRERLYVRHDVFTPDRAENRLMKSTADVMAKLSGDQQNVMSLRKLMMSLDEVKLSDNIDGDLSKCINARNTKKYNSVLAMCRLFLANKSRRVFKGRYVSFAMFFPMQDIFEAYIGRLVKMKHVNSNVILKPKGSFLCDGQKRFPTVPHVAIYDANGGLQCIMNARWSHPTSAREIAEEDILRLYAAARKKGCTEAMLIYPRTSDVRDMPAGSLYRIDGGDNINIHLIFEPLSEDSAAYIISEEEAEFTEDAVTETAEEAAVMDVDEAEAVHEEEDTAEEMTEEITTAEESQVEENTARPENKPAPVKVKLVRKK